MGWPNNRRYPLEPWETFEQWRQCWIDVLVANSPLFAVLLVPLAFYLWL